MSFNFSNGLFRPTVFDSAGDIWNLLQFAYCGMNKSLSEHHLSPVITGAWIVYHYKSTPTASRRIGAGCVASTLAGATVRCWAVQFAVFCDVVWKVPALVCSLVATTASRRG